MLLYPDLQSTFHKVPSYVSWNNQEKIGKASSMETIVHIFYLSQYCIEHRHHHYRLALSDTHIFLLNEYIVELNPANFNILNQILNWICKKWIFWIIFWIEFFPKLVCWIFYWIEFCPNISYWIFYWIESRRKNWKLIVFWINILILSP